MTRAEHQALRERQKQAKETEKQTLEAARGRMDIPFLLLTLLLTAMGLVMVFSASFPSAYYESGDPAYYFKRQAIFAAIGIIAMFVVSKFAYQRWRGAAKLLLGFSVFLLILVIIPHVGITVNNATRWLGKQGVFTFQPSEIAKLGVIVYFADSISKKKDKMLTWRQGIWPYVAILAIIAALMMLEPHLSGTILIVGTGVVMMIVGGIRAWLVGLGVGLGKSRQKFLYLPEEHNDCIFAIVCEELGLIGACVIMLIFALLIIRGFWIALHARDRFGSLLVVGIVTQIALQTFLNIAVVSGLVPATGISLPFFSYGGTALALQLFEMGIVLSVSRQIPAPKNG